MADKHEFEIFVAIDQEGNHEAANTAEDARQYLLDNNEDTTAIRIVRFVMKASLPDYEDVGEIAVPDSAGETEVIAAE